MYMCIVIPVNIMYIYKFIAYTTYIIYDIHVWAQGDNYY